MGLRPGRRAWEALAALLLVSASWLEPAEAGPYWLTPESVPAESRGGRIAGIESNLLVLRDRLIFAQADGDLVELRLSDGALMRRRRTGGGYRGHLRHADGTVLLHRDGRHLVGLDPDTFESRWRLPGVWRIASTDDLIVVDDPPNLMRVDGRTGRTEWSLELEDRDAWALAGRRILIIRSAVPEDEYLSHRPQETWLPATVRLLDAETGVLVSEHSVASDGAPSARLWFDGEKVLVGRRSANADLVVTDLGGGPVLGRLLAEEQGVRSASADHPVIGGHHLGPDHQASALGEPLMAARFPEPGLGLMLRRSLGLTPRASMSGAGDRLERLDGGRLRLSNERSDVDVTVELPVLEVEGAHVVDHRTAGGSLIVATNIGVVTAWDLASGQPDWTYASGLQWEYELRCSMDRSPPEWFLASWERSAMGARDAVLQRQLATGESVRWDASTPERFRGLGLRRALGLGFALAPLVLPLGFLVFRFLGKRRSTALDVARDFTLSGPTVLFCIPFSSADLLLPPAVAAWGLSVLAAASCALVAAPGGRLRALGSLLSFGTSTFILMAMAVMSGAF